MKKPTKLELAAVAAACVAAPTLAFAQQPGAPTYSLPTSPIYNLPQQVGTPTRNVTVQNRARPDYDPIGIRAGSFFIFPSFSAAVAFDDNVFATENDEEDDFYLQLSPRVDVRSNFSRHALNLSVDADVGLYKEQDENDYEDFQIIGDGRLDITRDDILTGRLNLGRLHEERTSPDAVGTEEATDYWSSGADVSYRKNFARLYTVLGARALRLDFEDTDQTNEDDRDRWEYGFDARVGYQLSPRFGTFVQGTYRWVEYDETPDDAGFNRNSEGFALNVGSTIDITGLLFGEVQVGYVRQTPEDDDLDTSQGPGGSGRLTWNVTPLTTIIFDAFAGILETTVAGGGDVAASDFQKRIGVDVTHELRRNILLNANAAYIRDDFEGINRSDNSFIAGAGVTYLLNRNLSVDATYKFSTRDSDATSAEYTRNVIRLGLTARL